jgi:hypothetical protein
MNQTDYIGISIYIRIVARLFSLSFFIHYIHRDILSPNKFSFPLLHIENCKRPRRFLFIPAKYFHSRCSMKISNIHVGTIHRNVRISNWAVSYFHISFIFSYQFHIFISVSYSHLSMYGSYVDVWYFHISFIFSYQFQILTFRCMVPTWTFDIFISVWYFHISFIFSYQFAILMSQLHHFLMCGFATSQPRVRLKQTISPCFKGGIDHTRRRQTST